MQPQVSRELAAVMEPWVVSIHPLLAPLLAGHWPKEVAEAWLFHRWQLNRAGPCPHLLSAPMPLLSHTSCCVMC